MDYMNKLEGHSFIFHEKPKKLVFLLHGYGDNAENFISLAEYLNDIAINVNFFAPNAPAIVPQHPQGRQWFNPYPNDIHYNEAGPKEKSIMKYECEVSIKQLEEYIGNLCLLNNLSYQDCFLIGFSQGAMIAYELGIYLRQKFSGCTMLSGRILSGQRFENNSFIKTPLLIVHGDNDDIINPQYFTETSQITKTLGFIVEKHLLKGEGHIISSETLQLVQDFIKKNV